MSNHPIDRISAYNSGARVLLFEGDSMQKIRMTVFFLAALLATPAIGQQIPKVAYFELIAIKPGMASQFEATLKRHWGWHTKQGETWSYFVWTVESGENTGHYRVASFGHTWKEVDVSNLAVAGTPDADADPEPFKSSTQASYFVFRPDLSYGERAPTPASLSSFLQISVKPESLTEFESALKGLYAAEEKNRTTARLSVHCYELVSGGEWPLFVLMEDRPDWTAFERGGLLETLGRASRKSDQNRGLVASFLSSVRSMHTEALQFHAGLSRIISPQLK